MWTWSIPRHASCTGIACGSAGGFLAASCAIQASVAIRHLALFESATSQSLRARLLGPSPQALAPRGDWRRFLGHPVTSCGRRAACSILWWRCGSGRSLRMERQITWTRCFHRACYEIASS